LHIDASGTFLLTADSPKIIILFTKHPFVSNYIY